jgi:hypothetical protein
MKIFVWLWTSCLFLSASSALAQSAEEIELARTIAETEKKVVVSENMDLTNAESEAFWPVYNNYQADVRKLNTRTIKLLRGYADDYLTLSDERAEEMLKEFLDIQNERVKLKKSYVKKFRKALPPKKLMRYYQVENKIDAMINIDLVKRIPLAK